MLSGRAAIWLGVDPFNTTIKAISERNNRIEQVGRELTTPPLPARALVSSDDGKYLFRDRVEAQPARRRAMGSTGRWKMLRAREMEGDGNCSNTAGLGRLPRVLLVVWDHGDENIDGSLPEKTLLRSRITTTIN